MISDGGASERYEIETDADDETPAHVHQEVHLLSPGFISISSSWIQQP
jgi:hypothetical protein